MKDIIIRGGTIYDGTGAPGVRADLAIEDGKITAIGDLSGEQAAEELDAAGLAVAPGFINIHGHSDTAFLLDDSFASLVYQGVTTEVCGNCGYTGFPALPPQEDGIRPDQVITDEMRVVGYDHHLYTALLEQGIQNGFGRPAETNRIKVFHI